MIVADVLAPWHCVEVTDAETGEVYEQRLRLPQFLHDVGEMAWQDVTAQRSETIPPTPPLCVWRVWLTDEQFATLQSLNAYTVRRAAECERQHTNPGQWPNLLVIPERENESDAFPPLLDSGWLEAGDIYQYGEQVVIVRKSHNRTHYEPSETPALFVVYRPNAADILDWVAGEQVYAGTLRTYNSVTYRCLQPHVTEGLWTPDITPALWVRVVDEEEPQPWVQPTGAHDAYQKGDRVTYGGFTWESIIDANVWAPGVYGWIQV